jgi:Protein of unknown function (DUF2892)
VGEVEAEVGGALGIILGVLGAIFLVTGVVGFCPHYTIFGIKARCA